MPVRHTPDDIAMELTSEVLGGPLTESDSDSEATRNTGSRGGVTPCQCANWCTLTEAEPAGRVGPRRRPAGDRDPT
jgi:hypothetical protein